MRTIKSTVFFLIFALAPVNAIFSQDEAIKSEIKSVKLYQNQALITRQGKIKLEKGENRITIGGLPNSLYDWSIKGKLPENYNGRILTLEVEQKALLSRKQAKIVTLEKKLEALRDKDLALVDKLKNNQSGQTFIDSIITFTNQNASKELATRIPQIKVWDETLKYVADKRAALLTQKRAIEKEREDLGKQMQQLEFELSQVAGDGYYRNYQSLSKAVMDNRGAMYAQQYVSTRDQFAENKRLFKETNIGQIDIEKRVNVHFSQARQARSISSSVTSCQILTGR